MTDVRPDVLDARIMRIAALSNVIKQCVVNQLMPNDR